MARPRDPDMQERICESARRLLLEVGYSGLSIEGIAKAAGVGKTTIYRRWPSKADLVFDAVYNQAPPAAEPLPIDLHQALKVLIQGLAQEFTTEEALAATSGLLSEFAARKDLAQRVRVGLLDPPYALVVGLLEQGQAQGAFRADMKPLLVADILFSTPFVSASMLGRPMNTDAVGTLVDHVLNGISAKDPGASS